MTSPLSLAEKIEKDVRRLGARISRDQRRKILLREALTRLRTGQAEAEIIARLLTAGIKVSR